MKVLGIDIGGTGIKGVPVNLETEEYIGERFRIPTPEKSTPKAISQCVQKLVDHFNWTGPVGVGFPTVIVNGKAMGYGNLSKKWLGVQINELFEKQTGLPFTVINDADAAGLAEMTYGAGVGLKGLVVVITIGTGIGSGFFYNGTLIPNFELGRMIYKKKPIEQYAANSARKRYGLTYEEWAVRFNFFLDYVENMCTPNHYILGGGISKHIDEFEHVLRTKVPLVAAQTKNKAGIIGAARAAIIKDL